ncbi:MAG: hypothetical protein WD490_10045, partial [Opitutales bacterium]
RLLDKGGIWIPLQGGIKWNHGFRHRKFLKPPEWAWGDLLDLPLLKATSANELFSLADSLNRL